MNELLQICVIVCPLCLLAGFIDSIAGGGGIISLPAYLLAGLPPYTAAGSNKFSACCGTLMAALKYMHGGKVVYKEALISGVGSLAGSVLGTLLALHIPEKALEYILLGALPLVALFLLLKKDFGQEPSKSKDDRLVKPAVLAFVIGLVIGCYDGMIGPGTGTFLILCFTGILGYDLLTSSGCAKVSNLASNFASMVVYLFNGRVLFAVAVPAAICSIIGNMLGARFALKGGSKNVRKVMFVVLALLFIKIGLDNLGLLM